MRIAILGHTSGWHIDQLTRAAATGSHEVHFVEFRRLWAELGRGVASLRLGELDLMTVDRVLVRGVPPGTLEQVVFRMDALHRLERAGRRVINPPSAIEACVDKYLATARIAAAGLPTPRTIVCEGKDDALVGFARLGGDVVLKPLFGSEGRGMLRLDRPALAERVIQTVSRLGEVFYLQEFIRHPGFDFRALIVGGRVVAAMKRFSNGDFRTNVSQGARAEACHLPLAWNDLATSAAKALGAPVCGVDLLPGPDGEPYVLEVNSTPGFRALAESTGVDIAAAIIDYLTAD